MESTENEVVWEHLIQPRETTGDANDDTDDEDKEEIDFIEENTMYRQISQPYMDEEYQHMWMLDEESDTEFDGFSNMTWTMRGVVKMILVFESFQWSF